MNTAEAAVLPGTGGTAGKTAPDHNAEDQKVSDF
jgi:hypothetical protein